MAEDNHDALARTLASVRARLGEDAFEDRRRVLALLADMLPGATRQTRLLGIAFDNGAVRALATVVPEQVELEIDRHAQRVDTDLGIRKAVMVPVLRAIAHALGRGDLPSSYAPVEASQVVVRPPARRDGTRPRLSAADSAAMRAAAPPPDLRAVSARPPPPPLAPPPAPAPRSAQPRAAAPAATPMPATAQTMATPSSPIAHSAPRVEIEGLGGWLIAWGVWLALYTLILAMSGMYMLWQSLHGVSPLSLLVLALLLAATALGAVVLRYFVQRSRRTRAAYSLWLIVAVMVPAGGQLLWQRYNVMTALLVIAIIAAIAGLAYFARSRRVRTTFVR